MAASPYIVILGAILNLLGSVQYIRNTLRGVTRPNRVSWFLWGVAPLIGVAAAWSDGVRWPLLPVFMAGFCPLLIFVASFCNKQAYWESDWFDKTCAVLCVIALAYWAYTRYWTHLPEAALIVSLAIAADAFAAFPTIRKCWHHPDTETAFSFVMATLSAITSFLVIAEWKFAEWAFPAYLTGLGITLCLIIFGRRAFVSRPNASSQ